MSKQFDVNSVLSQLSVEEKVSLTAGVDYWHTFPIHRLNVPSIRTSDGPNGIRGQHHFNSTPTATVPTETGLGSSWNPDLVSEIGVLLAGECEAKGAHTILGPTVNIQRSPLGGRGFESFSEDPYLSGRLAASYINGFQKSGLAATIKHFVCNDQEHERFSQNSIVTQRALREIYLRPFEIAIKEAKPRGVMTSYNKVNGVHASESTHLLKDILRGEWNWKGLVMSDWTGTYSTTAAINAGLDLEMPGPTRWRGVRLNHALFSQKISFDTLDERARNVLEFVNSVIDAGVPENAPEIIKNTSEDQKLLRKAAGEAAVLLKNDDGILPLSDKKKVLVIGANAIYTAYSGGGSALSTPYYKLSPYDAIADHVGATNVSFEIGAYSHRYLPPLDKFFKTDGGLVGGADCNIFNEPEDVLDRKSVDSIHLRDISYFRMNDYFNKKLKDETLFYGQLTTNFTPVAGGVYEFGISVFGTAKLYLDDELIVDNATKQTQGDSFYGKGTAEVVSEFNIQAGKTYKLRLEFGSGATSKLVVENKQFFGGGGIMFGGAPKVDPKEAILKAANAARDAEQVVIVSGLNKEWESEGSDRKTMKLPGFNDELISAVLEANNNTVVVIQAGTPVEMPWEKKAKALVYTSYGGNETGHGISDALFGVINPSGKLPLSFPKRLEDSPSFINYGAEKGRVLYGEDVYVGYRFFSTTKRDVLFPFGHGLSYSTFEISDASLKKSDSELNISFSVTNTGNVDGAEVVQIYVSPLTSSIRRPVKELKGFTKEFLKVGEKRTVELTLDLLFSTSYWDEEYGKWNSEKGDYEIIIGTSSEDTKSIVVPFKIGETTRWVKALN